MNGLPYYKAYPRDFIEGTIGMPFELKAAYRLVLDLIYMQGGRLPDDAQYISGLLGCSVRKWNALRKDLLNQGKIVAENGIISNFRADKELETLRKFSRSQSEKRSRPNKNNEIKSPQSHHTEPESEPEEKEPSVPKSEDGLFGEAEPDRPKPPTVRDAVNVWTEVCVPVGMAKVASTTGKRGEQIGARLKEHGIDGWRAACEAAAASPFWRGERPPSPGQRQFRGNIDAFSRPSNFAKLLEGFYEPDKPKSGAASDDYRAFKDMGVAI